MGVFEIERAILSFVDEFTVPRVPAGELAPELFERPPGCQPRLKNAWILSDRLRRRITSDLGKLRVDVQDAGIQIRDDHRGRALLNGGRQRTQLLFVQLAFSDVMHGCHDMCSVTGKRNDHRRNLD